MVGVRLLDHCLSHCYQLEPSGTCLVARVSPDSSSPEVTEVGLESRIIQIPTMDHLGIGRVALTYP